jgi:hypothetical protein
MAAATPRGGMSDGGAPLTGEPPDGDPMGGARVGGEWSCGDPLGARQFIWVSGAVIHRPLAGAISGGGSGWSCAGFTCEYQPPLGLLLWRNRVSSSAFF